MTNNSAGIPANISTDFYLKNAPKKSVQTGDSNLGKDAFLQLLVTQLQHQDPTAPMDNSEFIAQMAQFSSLEQMQNMTSSIEKLIDMQGQSQLIQYSNFLGQSVNWAEVTEEQDEKGDFITNTGTNRVTGVSYVDGSPVFLLDNGKEITPGNIAGLSATETATTNQGNGLVQASALIGKMVEYLIDDIVTTAQVTSVSMKDGNVMYTLANEDSIQASQFTAIRQS